MIPIILFRKNLQDEGEFDVCKKYFKTIEYRTELTDYKFFPVYNPNLLVIPRYSALPYYQELEKDINNLGGTLINSYKQHKWIADFEWYDSLKEYTPESWNDDTFFLCQKDCQFVIKGKTNSKKHQWNKLMFAENKRKALEIAGELIQDSMIGEQGIIYREYVPLETYEIGLNGIRFTNEWRFFFYRTNLLCYGYYWSIAEVIDHKIDPKAIEFARYMAHLCSSYANFFVLDVAEKQEGGWILIEVNDGSCSGLSECRADELYSSLKKVLT